MHWFLDNSNISYQSESLLFYFCVTYLLYLNSEIKLIEALQDDRKKRFADVPEEKIQLYTAGTMQNKEDIEHWVAAVQAAFPNKVVSYAQLPCSIASHVGPDCKGIGLSVIS